MYFNSEVSVSFQLDSSCDRVGWHRYVNASLHSCPLERFIDVVYAFSEGALFDNITDARLIDSLHSSSPFAPAFRLFLIADSMT